MQAPPQAGSLLSSPCSCSTPPSEKSCCSAGCCYRGCKVRSGAGIGLPTASLFALYHLHEPWLIPSSLVDIFALSYPSRRYRSALIGIIVHSSQSFLFLALLLGPSPHVAGSVPAASDQSRRARPFLYALIHTSA